MGHPLYLPISICPWTSHEIDNFMNLKKKKEKNASRPSKYQDSMVLRAVLMSFKCWELNVFTNLWVSCLQKCWKTRPSVLLNGSQGGSAGRLLQSSRSMLESKGAETVQARFKHRKWWAPLQPKWLSVQRSFHLIPASYELAALHSPQKVSQNSFCLNSFSALFKNAALVQKRHLITGQIFGM